MYTDCYTYFHRLTFKNLPYPLLCSSHHFGLNDDLSYLQGAARGAFLAYISDTHIGATYYTLLASLNNLGSFVSLK
jgi:hypothetical protein